MKITSTLIVSVFGLLLGITELIMAAIGLAEDLYCNEHAYNVHNCFYSVIKKSLNSYAMF